MESEQRYRGRQREETMAVGKEGKGYEERYV